MKVSGKGIIVILVFLVVIPCMTDIVFVSILPTRELPFTMSVFLLTRYLRWLPVYIVYLVIAFGIISLVRIYKEQSTP